MSVLNLRYHCTKDNFNLQVTVPSAFKRIQGVEDELPLVQVTGIRMILPDRVSLLSDFH